jgi:hypothetical protein
MHANRSGRWARLIIIAGLLCFVLVGLIIRPASALPANPDPVCSGLDCSVTFGPAAEPYEWFAPAGSSKIWVQLEGSQDVVSGARGDLKVVAFWSDPYEIVLTVEVSSSLRAVSDPSKILTTASGGALGNDTTYEPTVWSQDDLTSELTSIVLHGGAPAGTGHAIVHYKQAAVQSPAPVVTSTPYPTPTASATPTAEPRPAAVLPSPQSETPTSPPTSEPTPEPPTVESVAVVAAPVVEAPPAPVVVESPVAETSAPDPAASVTEDADSEFVTPYLSLPIEAPVRVTSTRKVASSRQRIIQVFSNPRALEMEEIHPVAAAADQIKNEPSIAEMLSTSIEIAAVALGGVGVILGIQSARRKKLAAHRKRFRLVKAFS